MTEFFGITEQQQKTIEDWETQQNQIRISEMLESDDNFLIEMAKEGTPYYGAIGGSLTYSFTPTSIGVVLKVKHGFTENVLDVTEYDNW